MGESTDEIRNEIAMQRNILGKNLNELETKAKSLTDWRAQFEKNPMTMVGVAFAGGLLIATIAGGKRSRRSSSSTEVRSISGPATKTEQTWDHVKGALFGLATGKAINFLDEVIPGFGEHFGKEQSQHPLS